MKLTKWLLTASCALALGVPHAWPQPPAQPTPMIPDFSKTKRIEPAVKQVVAATAPVAPAPDKPIVLDVSKFKVVEAPTTKLVASSAASGDADNPTVEPGKVKWHKTLADARAAAEKSGRPVLLFHMMGQLDKQFC
jgi:hypothetical protein